MHALRFVNHFRFLCCVVTVVGSAIFAAISHLAPRICVRVVEHLCSIIAACRDRVHRVSFANNEHSDAVLVPASASFWDTL